MSLLVYLLTRLIRLSDFPIYFFTDEAVQTVLAGDLIRDGFKGYDGRLLPAFFPNGGKYNLGTSVYLQVLPELLFDRSIGTTRATAALSTLLAAASLYLILKIVFHNPYPWLGILILAATPVWFLHSRTAFETCLAASFYAAFFYCYLRYRTDQPRFLYPAVGMAALAFYSYTPMRIVVLVTACLLFLADIPYHWQQRKLVLMGTGLAFLLAVPYGRFILAHPGENASQLHLLSAYWFQPLPLLEKLRRYGNEYLQGLNPLYWYLPHADELPRHVMKGYGHLLWASLPFMLAGLGLTLRKFRLPIYRAVLILLLAAPSGAALVQTGTTRMMNIVIPHVLLSALGLSAGLQWLEKRRPLSRRVIVLPVFGLFTAFSFWMLGDALRHGPLWYQDYSMTGMQYGTQELFASVQETLHEQPGREVYVSPSWANGTDILARFMLGDPLPITLESIYGYLEEQKELPPARLFILTPEEYQTALKSQKFSGIVVERTLSYPNGKTGFYFVRLQYVNNIAQILKQEKQELYAWHFTLVENQGQEIEVRYQTLDKGEIVHLFDHDPQTFIRSAAANPLQLQLIFSRPLSISRVGVHIGGAATTLVVSAYDTRGSLLAQRSQTYPSVPDPHTVNLEFNVPQPTAALHIFVQNAGQQQPSHVHLWEIDLH